MGGGPYPRSRRTVPRGCGSNAERDRFRGRRVLGIELALRAGGERLNWCMRLHHGDGDRRRSGVSGSIRALGIDVGAVRAAPSAIGTATGKRCDRLHLACCGPRSGGAIGSACELVGNDRAGCHAASRPDGFTRSARYQNAERIDACGPTTGWSASRGCAAFPLRSGEAVRCCAPCWAAGRAGGHATRLPLPDAPPAIAPGGVWAVLRNPLSDNRDGGWGEVGHGLMGVPGGGGVMPRRFSMLIRRIFWRWRRSIPTAAMVSICSAVKR